MTAAAEYIKFKNELGSLVSDPKALAIKVRLFLDLAKRKGWYIDNDIKNAGGTPVTAVSQQVRAAPPKPDNWDDAKYARFKAAKGYE